MVQIFSQGIKQIPHLESFLKEEYDSCRQGQQVVVGWGHKATASKARAYAKANALTYYALEDGFLRSLRLGVEGAAPISMTVDPVGVYYDANEPSILEEWLNDWKSWFTSELKARARKAMNLMRYYDLSKYNSAPSCTDGRWEDFLRKQQVSPSTRKILLVDQTAGDASIQLGRADTSSFARMLSEALSEPDSEVFVKTHPDVAVGKKQSCFPHLPKNVHLITESFAPLGFIKRFDEVRVVTSQMGFEALMAGVPVRTYGIPFYAGWGLTVDFGELVERRQSEPPLEALFAAAYIRLTRYVNPVFGNRMSLEEAIDFLAAQRTANERNRGDHLAIGFRRWKKPHVQNFLSGTDSKIDFIVNPEQGLKQALELCKTKEDSLFEVVRWAGRIPDSEAEEYARNAIPLTRMEDGFLRSVGLGVDFTNPYSLVLDRSGIYYDPRSECDLIKILKTVRNRPDYERLVERAEELRLFIIENNLSKYNIQEKEPDGQWLHQIRSEAKGKKILLVVGQVDGDQSVKRGGGRIQSCRALLEHVRKCNPDSFVLYKPHPDVSTGNREGAVPPEVQNRLVDRMASEVPLSALWEFVDELHTLTSLTGFEALLRNKRVVTYGRPFYSGWGLTTDFAINLRQQIPLKLHDLIVGTLLIYPMYWDWQTLQFARAEDVARRLANKEQQTAPLWVRGCRVIKNCKIRMRSFRQKFR